MKFAVEVLHGLDLTVLQKKQMLLFDPQELVTMASWTHNVPLQDRGLDHHDNDNIRPWFILTVGHETYRIGSIE